MVHGKITIPKLVRFVCLQKCRKNEESIEKAYQVSLIEGIIEHLLKQEFARFLEKEMRSDEEKTKGVKKKGTRIEKSQNESVLPGQTISIINENLEEILVTDFNDPQGSSTNSSESRTEENNNANSNSRQAQKNNLYDENLNSKLILLLKLKKFFDSESQKQSEMKALAIILNRATGVLLTVANLALLIYAIREMNVTLSAIFEPVD